MRLCDAETMRQLDHSAIHETGIPGIALMENAGRGTAELMNQRWSAELTGGVTIFCGRGNNGGDGFVIARHLHNAGFPVQVLLFASRQKISGDAAVNLAICEAMGIDVVEILNEDGWAYVKASVLARPIMVDALLGTGLNSEVRGLIRAAIEAINGVGGIVVAVDMPSGLDTVSGRPQGIAVKATLTVTFGLAKLGQVLEPALPYVGELRVLDIGLPREKLAMTSVHDRLLDASTIAGLLPHRPREGHKGTFGHLEIVAGSIGKVGAAVLACHAALKSGVGLVSLALPMSAAPYLQGLWPEVMLDLLEDNGRGFLGPDAVEPLMDILSRRTAVAIGPGLSTAKGVVSVLDAVWKGFPLPLVVDADGLNMLSEHLDILLNVRKNVLLTPHPGEAARILGVTAKDVQEDRIGSLKRLVKDTQSIVVLKGHRTLVGNTFGRISVNPTGNSGMGTAGAGDVLTGLIGGLAAQGIALEAAAVAAVYLHGLAGDLAARQHGQRALTAGLLLDFISAAFCSVAGDCA